MMQPMEPMDSIDPAAFEETLANARRALLEARNAKGHWEGELSSSALSTATAVFALSLHPKWRENPLVARGLEWLQTNQNADGGWGDTIKSLSNISTTALCWAAFAAARDRETHRDTLARAEAWLSEKAGGVDPDHLIPAIIKRYGKDRTFSVPILTMCALAGRLGEGREAWKRIPQLPFELAAFPQRWFKWLRLPVVSYALPALIAIGLVRHKHRPTRNPLSLAARRLACRRALRLLEKIQPTTGGYLEATPLTSFVVMSLIGAGLADHPVVHRGIEFLVRSARPDGSWPIDTNLATWVTTLAVNALAIDPDFHEILPEPERLKIRDWLLGQQYTTEHPYTLANPGGVPDADDTPGALLALKNLRLIDDRTKRAADLGVRWLLDLQNRDGGIPTFCRGWGKLPFDRSSPDLTAHTLRAIIAWAGEPLSNMPIRVRAGFRRALSFLDSSKNLRMNGSWVPLWFGNQYAKDEENPTYGTAKVLVAAGAMNLPAGLWATQWARWIVGAAVEWLVYAQRTDGGWGGGRNTPASIEETALAVEGLVLASVERHLTILEDLPSEMPAAQLGLVNDSVARGVAWLIEHTDHGTRFDPSPIGFYFAKLWYFEKLYPLIFTVAALNAVKVSITKNQEKTAKTRSREEDLKALS
jgi:squalene-hopene/tetraprenyl-beta-curcumene cyclase